MTSISDFAAWRGNLIAGLLSGSLILTSAVGASAQETRTVEADNGTVEIPADPQRIVTIGSPALFLNLSVAPVGMNYVAGSGLDWLTPEERQAQEAAVDIGSGANLDYESVASLQPDLIAIHIPQHAWNNGILNVERLQSIAPTIWIEINNSEWKTQSERLADALGVIDIFEAERATYDGLIAEIQDEYGDFLDAATFAVVNRWASTDEGAFTREYAGSYCTTYLGEAGLNIVGESAEGRTFEDISIEWLSDMADVDAILYPLGPDGEPKVEFAPILETNVWQALPPVIEGHALGVKCNTVLSYSSKIMSLKSLEEALETLASAQ